MSNWNTWDARRPAAYVHLPSGLAIRVAAFSSASGRATAFPLDGSVRLGPHLADGSYAGLELAHDGARLRLAFACDGDGLAAGEVRVLETAEWALRFWFLVEVGFVAPGEGTRVRLREPEGEARYLDPPVALATWPGGVLAFAPEPRPVGAHLYDDPGEAMAELEAHGYYYRPPPRAEAAWAVFRFNAVTPRVAFAAATGADEDEAGAALAGRAAEAAAVLADRAAAAGAEGTVTGGAATGGAVTDGAGANGAGANGAGGAGEAAGGGVRAGTGPGRAAAIRDVVAWSTVWDPVHGRAYTAAARGWVGGRFGSWVVWQLDTFLHVLLAARAGDFDSAHANLDAALSLATGHGNLAALRSEYTAWDDRAHPPVGALATWALYQATGDREVLERAWPVLARAWHWWFEARDGNGNGLLEYGSSPVGDGHFVHTRQAAMDESAMDNSPVHDQAEFVPANHTLDMEDVGLNSLLVLEGELLARMAAELVRPGDAGALAARSTALAARVQSGLWDRRRRIFANRRWDGSFAASLAPTSFYPLLAGIATREQAAAMVEGHLLDPERFGGPWPVAGTPHDDPAARDNVYWRGRVWPCLNFLVYRGLRRYRHDDAAAALAARSAELFERGWRERRSYESYNQRSGDGGDSADADPFYAWGALLPLLGELEVLDFDPFDGLVAGTDGTARACSVLPAAGGDWRAELDGRSTRVLRDGKLLLQASFRGRLRDLRLDEGEAVLQVPPLRDGGVLRVRLHGELLEGRLAPGPARRVRLTRDRPGVLEVEEAELGRRAATTGEAGTGEAGTAEEAAEADAALGAGDAGAGSAPGPG